MFSPKTWILEIYLGTSLAITIVIDSLAMKMLSEWNQDLRYSDLIPVISWFDVGRVPIGM